VRLLLQIRDANAVSCVLRGGRFMKRPGNFRTRRGLEWLSLMVERRLLSRSDSFFVGERFCKGFDMVDLLTDRQLALFSINLDWFCLGCLLDMNLSKLSPCNRIISFSLKLCF
jgi:hypothetical protein